MSWVPKPKSRKDNLTMVPALIHDAGQWLDRFSKALDRWESILGSIQKTYLLGEHSQIFALCFEGEEVHREIQECKSQREQLLKDAQGMGYSPRSLRDLSLQFDSQWPSLWTLRISNLELQLDRIQQLSMSMWVTAFQSKSFVADMLMILATGKSESATYSPSESHSHEGGFLVNEAA
jgi:hypothetical protein